MRCPYCQSERDRVVDSRPAQDGAAVRRRRQCDECHHRYSTMERLEQPTLTVIKRDGSREVFAPEKLLAGVVKATTNLDVHDDAIRRAVADIEAQLRGSSATEVDSGRIGQAMLTVLRDLHEVAYLRFASVYKGFTGREDFQREIAGLPPVRTPKH